MELTTPRGRFHFDQVIATIPSRRFLLMAPQLAPEYARKLTEVKYLGVVCFVLLLKRRLSPYYVLNLTEESLPFTGVIEMTNLVSLSETAGYHLVYLPKYTVPGDPSSMRRKASCGRASEKDFDEYARTSRTPRSKRGIYSVSDLVQPIPVLNYSDIVPEMSTNIDGLFLANTTQIINSNLNNNAMVKIANRAVQLVLKKYSNTGLSAHRPVSDAVSLETRIKTGAIEAYGSSKKTVSDPDLRVPAIGPGAVVGHRAGISRWRY